jgi:hypothetical protein
MNTISNSHKLFSENLNNPRVLENPKEFLGPNYEEVLNFWLILDDLSEEQWRVVSERYWAFFDKNRSEWRKATDLAIDASVWAADVTNSWAARWATRELIGMHKILEDQQNPLTFFDMFLEVL